MKKNEVVLDQRVPIRERFAFALGDIAANFFLQMISVFILIFYTDVLGIAAGIAATIAMLSRIFDGINDLIIGYLADKYGNLKKWVFWGCLASGVLFMLMFYSPDISKTGKAVYALLTFVLWTVAYTCYQIPYTTLNSTITSDETERVKLNSIRFVVILVPMLLVSVGMPMLMPRVSSALGGQDKAYLFFAAIFGIIGFACAAICVNVIKERVVQEKVAERIKFKDAIKVIFNNKPLLLLSLAWLCSSLQHNITNASAPYFFTYYVGDSTMLSPFMMMTLSAMAIGMLIVPTLSKKFGSSRVIVFSGVMMFITSLLRYFMASNLILLGVFTIIGFCFHGCVTPLAFSLVSETVDYGQRKTGKNVRALNFSIFVFMQKLAMAFSATVVGLVLEYSGYIPNVTQNPQVLSGILMLYTLIPALVTLLMGLVMIPFNVDK